MNNDLIRREDAIRAGREIPELIFNHYFGEGDVEALMNAIPAVDAEPVRQWISVKDRLPNENEYVLIFADSIQVARLIKGISEEERTMMRNGEIEDPLVWCWDGSKGHHRVPKSALYGPSDVFGNNTVPYSWKANGGPMSWFGQDVSHWMPLPELPKLDEEKAGE